MDSLSRTVALEVEPLLLADMIEHVLTKCETDDHDAKPTQRLLTGDVTGEPERSCESDQRND